MSSFDDDAQLRELAKIRTLTDGLVSHLPRHGPDNVREVLSDFHNELWWEGISSYLVVRFSLTVTHYFHKLRASAEWANFGVALQHAIDHLVEHRSARSLGGFCFSDAFPELASPLFQSFRFSWNFSGETIETLEGLSPNGLGAWLADGVVWAYDPSNDTWDEVWDEAVIGVLRRAARQRTIALAADDVWIEDHVAARFNRVFQELRDAIWADESILRGAFRHLLEAAGVSPDELEEYEITFGDGAIDTFQRYEGTGHPVGIGFLQISSDAGHDYQMGFFELGEFFYQAVSKVLVWYRITAPGIEPELAFSASEALEVSDEIEIRLSKRDSYPLGSVQIATMEPLPPAAQMEC